MKSGDLIKLAIIAGGGYLLYKYMVDSGLWAQWFGGATPSAGTTSSSLPAGVSQPQGSAAQLIVQTPSGNPSQLKVGDSYTISVHGAPPNQHVDVTAIMTGGATIPNAVGDGSMTDAAGTYVTHGVVTADHVGTWSEIWKVGTQLIGVWNFTIAPAPSVSGVGAIIPAPNSGPITVPLPAALPPMPSFGGGGYRGGSYGSSLKKTNSWVQ